MWILQSFLPAKTIWQILKDNSAKVLNSTIIVPDPALVSDLTGEMVCFLLSFILTHAV